VIVGLARGNPSERGIPQRRPPLSCPQPGSAGMPTHMDAWEGYRPQPATVKAMLKRKATRCPPAVAGCRARRLPWARFPGRRPPVILAA